MRVLLTGATGFIGCHVARELLRQGCTVTVLLRPGGNRHRLAGLLDSLHIIEAALDSQPSYEAALVAVRPDVGIHLAWYMAPGNNLSSPKNVACLHDSIQFLQVLGEVACRRVLVAGSSVEYDTDFGYLSEGTPARPRNLYGACKQAMSLVGRQLARQAGQSFVVARIFNVYGPWEDERRLVPHVIRRLLAGEPCDLTSGDQIRDYLHVEDVARALVAVALGDLEGVVNVASSCPTTVAAVARELEVILERPGLLRFGARPGRPDEPPFVCGDSSLLRSRTDWAPAYGLTNGLRQTVDWWIEKLHVAIHEQRDD